MRRGTLSWRSSATGRMLRDRAHLLHDLQRVHPQARPRFLRTTAATLITGCYDIPAAPPAVAGRRTNRGTDRALPGAGRPDAAYMLERLVDDAARADWDRPNRISARADLIRSFDTARRSGWSMTPATGRTLSGSRARARGARRRRERRTRACGRDRGRAIRRARGRPVGERRGGEGRARRHGRRPRAALRHTVRATRRRSRRSRATRLGVDPSEGFALRFGDSAKEFASWSGDVWESIGGHGQDPQILVAVDVIEEDRLVIADRLGVQPEAVVFGSVATGRLERAEGRHRRTRPGARGDWRGYRI